MSKADEIFIQNMRDILDNGVWDTDLPVRPRWSDGTPAHTVKKFGIVNKNKDDKKLKKEFETWKKQAKEKINDMKKGKLTENEVYKWILKNK